MKTKFHEIRLSKDTKAPVFYAWRKSDTRHPPLCERSAVYNAARVTLPLGVEPNYTPSEMEARAAARYLYETFENPISTIVSWELTPEQTATAKKYIDELKAEGVPRAVEVLKELRHKWYDETLVQVFFDFIWEHGLWKKFEAWRS